MGKKKSWGDLSKPQQRGVGLLGLIQFGLLVFALQDWFRRPDKQIRGRKKLWFPVLFVNFIGPIAYLAVGRER